MTNQNKKQNKFKLASILKLHTRIMNSNLKLVADSLVATLAECSCDTTTKKLIDLLEIVAVTGGRNCDVAIKAKSLNWSADQEILKDLFNTVTESNESYVTSVRNKSKPKCQCPNCNPKATSKPTFKDVSGDLNIKDAKVFEVHANGASIADVINEIVKQHKPKSNKGN